MQFIVWTIEHLLHKNYNEILIDWMIGWLIDYCPDEMMNFVMNTWFVYSNDVLKFTNFINTVQLCYSHYSSQYGLTQTGGMSSRIDEGYLSVLLSCHQ